MAEENHKKNPFNPFIRFGLKSVLSNIAPEFYSTKELSQLAEIESTFSLSEIINNEKKKYHLNDQGSTSNAIVQLPQPPPPPPPALILPLPLPLPPPPALPLPLPLPPPLPELPAHIRNRITDLNGTNARYVMRKTLHRTDLNIGNNRLSMPCSDIRYDFLTEIEKAILDSKKDDKPLGLDVVVLDPYFREFHMCLKKWTMATCVYNLMRNWKHLLNKNNWLQHNKLHHRLHIWSFRINDKLHFVLDDNEDI